MVPPEEALPSQRLVQRVEAETSGILQLLWSERQLREPAAILWGSNADSAEMAQPAQSAEELQLGRVPPAGRTFSGASAPHPPTSGKDGGVCKLNPGSEGRVGEQAG